MAITIQELIASDTISQAVDKINFNFDQLLLNGGGPVGPAGPIGPSGPIGGRGERGTEWYEGTDNPNVTPPTITPLQADYYLQSNGDVWEYTGLTWTNTGINLTGPQGPTGSSVGWSQFGNAPNPGSPSNDTYSATAKNVSYPSLMNQLDNTLNANNEGVPVAAFGIAGPNDNDYPGIPLTSAFKLNTLIAGQLDSSKLSTFIHQKDSGTRSIVFMGGGNIPGENFEQNDLDKMVNISIGTDDKLLLNVPKKGTIGATSSDLAGLLATVDDRGFSFRAGNNFIVDTGTKGSQDFANDNSDVNFKLSTLAGAAQPAEFNVTTIGTGGNNRFAIGGGFAPPALDPGFDGDISIETNNIYGSVNSIFAIEVGSELKLFNNTPGNSIGLTSTAITLNAGGVSTIDASTSGGDITLQTTGGGETNVYSNTGTNMKTGNSAIETDASSIRLIGGGTDPNNNIKIYSALPGSSVSLGLGGGNSTGKIQIGQRLNGVYWQDYAAIELNYADLTSGIINLRGAIQYTKDGTYNPTNASNQSIFIDANIADYVAGDVIMRHGDPTQFMDMGLAHEGWHDYTQASVWIGKGGEGGFGADDAGLGIFLNANEQWSQGAQNQPTNERFAVCEDWTKISNHMIWGGGKNNQGKQVFEFDPLMNVSPNLEIVANKPYVQIFVGPINSGSYSWTNYSNGTISAKSINWTFELKPPTTGLYNGQRVTIEIIYYNSRIVLQDQRNPPPYPPSVTLTTAGIVNLEWAMNDGSGAPQQNLTLVTSPVGPYAPLSLTAPTSLATVVGRRWVGDFIYNGDTNVITNTPGNTPNQLLNNNATPEWSLIGHSGIMSITR